MKHTRALSLLGGASASLAISLVLLFIIWHVTTPLQSGPLGILLVFTLIYIFFTALIVVLLGVWSAVAARIGRTRVLSARKQYYVSSVLGLLPVLYLTLLSMGGASVWGVVLVVLFVGLTLFYVLKRTA